MVVNYCIFFFLCLQMYPHTTAAAVVITWKISLCSEADLKYQLNPCLNVLVPSVRRYHLPKQKSAKGAKRKSKHNEHHAYRLSQATHSKESSAHSAFLTTGRQRGSMASPQLCLFTPQIIVRAQSLWHTHLLIAKAISPISSIFCTYICPDQLLDIQ